MIQPGAVRRSRLTLLLWPTLLLSACAPTQTMDSGPAGQWSEAEQQAICAQNPRIGEGGTLLWGKDESWPAPYRLTCPALAILAQEGTVTVRAATLSAALAAFSDGAFMMTYYADYRLRLGPDLLLTMDDPQDIPEALRDQVTRTRITAQTPGGGTHTLLWNLKVTPLRLQAVSPVTLKIAADGYLVAWPTIVLDPANATVTASMR